MKRNKRIHDPLTYRYPRSLEDAFGDDQRSPVFEQDKQRMDPSDKLVITVCGLASVFMIVMMLAGWLPGGAQ